MKTIYSFSAILIISASLFSCSGDDDAGSPAGNLTANAGPDQTVAPFTTVSLDGSASTGSNDNSFNYEWIVIGGPVSVFLNNSSAVNPSFEPTKNGIYQFTLRITNGNEFSEDQVQITVTGAIDLSGTLSQSTTLLDIDSDPDMPDYLISADLTIPDGVTLDFDNASNSGIVLKVAEGVGIIVQKGGRIVIANSGGQKFTSDTNWKGILVDGGTIDFSVFMTIENAGVALFDGQPEPAAITFAGTAPSITALSQVNFVNSGSYDLLVLSPTSGSDGIVSNNTFSFSKPIKAPITFVSKVSFNTYPASYDYLHFVPSGAGTIDVATGSLGFKFPPGVKSFIDGDFSSDSPITMQDATILMKEGAGILSQKRFELTSSSVISGINGSNWKGIAFASASEQMIITSSTIENAGSDVFNTGFFSTSVKAAIFYSSSNVSNLNSSSIVNSGGYGIYIDHQSGTVAVQGSTFSGTALPAVRTRVDRVHTVVSTGNTFTMPAAVAAVEVFVPNLTTTPVSTWRSLGGSNYYLLSNNARQSGGTWTLASGVNLRFKAGKMLELEQGIFSAIGTATDPITFDGEAGTAASWAGIHVQTIAKFEFCQIKNGGDVFIQKNGVTPATEKANVVFNYGGGNTSSTFKNNTISGSGGYGILVESGKQDPDALNVANNNMFSTNTDGDAIVQP